jgi:hypothetical protein
MGLRPKAGDRGIDCASAEDQDRDVQRQDEQRKQHAAAAHAQRERGTDRPDAGQGGRTDQQ